MSTYTTPEVKETMAIVNAIILRDSIPPGVGIELIVALGNERHARICAQHKAVSDVLDAVAGQTSTATEYYK